MQRVVLFVIKEFSYNLQKIFIFDIMIRNIILDMGGVLMQHNIPGCIARLKELTGANFPRLGMDDKGEGTELMGQFERGLVSLDDFLTQVLALCRQGTTREQVFEAWVTIHAGIPAERLNYVHQLKAQGYRLYLLSNNNDACWQDIASQYDMSVFDELFLSHWIHIIKPDAALFEYVQKRLNLNPDETVFVDDIEVNRLAAQRAVGWRTAESLEALKAML